MQNRLFIELIKVSIGNMQTLSFVPSAKEWKMLFLEAKRQSLLGICFAGVHKIRLQQQQDGKITIPQQLYLGWLGIASKIMQLNEKMAKQCVEIQDVLSGVGFESYILKGQGVECCYDEKLRGLRQPGDIDVWVIGAKKSILAFIKKYHPLRHCDYMHTHFDYFKDTEVEVHFRPWISRNLVRNHKLQKLAKEYYDAGKLERNNSSMVVPDKQFQILHVLNHIYWHLLVEGVGLRQMLDLYYVLTPLDDKGGLMKIIEWLGLEKFTSAAMWVLGDVFGLKREDMLCEPSEKEGRFLWDEIMMAGNFGKYDERIKHSKGGGRIGLMMKWMRHSFRLFGHYPKDVLWNPIGIIWLSMKGKIS